jgi:hypothetical protein
MITDTNGSLFPEGNYQFRVAEIPYQLDVKGYTAWQWSFEAETEEGPRIYNERFMVWLLAPLLRSLGFDEVGPGKFNWEPTEAVNRVIPAAIKHVLLDKGTSAGKTVARMTLTAAVKPPSKTVAQAAISAQAPAGKDSDDIPF